MAAICSPKSIAVFLALVLVAIELLISNRGTPEREGSDLSRYQTRGIYIPSKTTEVFSEKQARSHWVYYVFAVTPLALMFGVLVLGSVARKTRKALRIQYGLNVISGVVSVGAFVSILWILLAAKFPRISWTIFPPPILVVQSFGNYYQPPGRTASLIAELLPGAAHTSAMLFVAILLATWLALFLGLTLGHLRTLSAWVSPYVYIISPLPPIVLYPVVNALLLPTSVQLVLGRSVNDPDRWLVLWRDLALTTWAIFWPIFAAALEGSRSVSPRLLAVAQLLGAARSRRLWKIVLPQSIGSILTNFRLGVIMGMIVLLFAQAKGGEPNDPQGFVQRLFVPGLGGKLADLDTEQNLAPILACVVVVIAVVLAFDFGRYLVERLFCPWLRLQSAPSGPIATIQELEVDTSLESVARNLASFLPQRVANPVIAVDGLVARFGDFTLKIPELKIFSGQIVSLIGKSSSGKTSLVEVIAGMGLHNSLAGVVKVNGHDVYSAGGLRNDNVGNLGIGFVHQDYGLFPHMTVRKNLDFAVRLKRQGWTPAQRRRSKELEPLIRRQLFEFLGLVSDRDISAKYPSQLSGGQRQRVAIARALLTAEPLLVLDEGLNSIDQPTRGIIRDGLSDLVRRLGLTLLTISHDNRDVIQMSDRVLYMERVNSQGSSASTGMIVADTTPRDFYYTPASEEAARFIGHYNVFKVDHESEGAASDSLLLYPGTLNGNPIKIAKDRIPLKRRDNILVIPASWVNPSWDLKDSTFTGVIRAESFAGPHHELTIVCEGGFALRAIVQDDDYLFLASQEVEGPTRTGPHLEGRTVGLSIGHLPSPRSS